jgi:hypothetical protein
MTEPTTAVASDTLYCANHPQTETQLRCNKCGKPICTKCAVRTPVGYRCRECVRGQQAIFETALWYDYLVAAVICLPLGAISTAILGNFGFFMFFLAPVAGGVTAELVRAAVRRRRGRYLLWAATGAFALGCLAVPGLSIVTLLALAITSGQSIGGVLLPLGFGLLWPLIYAVISTGTLYARLRGISV